jgi:hypothetical protein
LHRLGHELRAIVGTNVAGHAAQDEETGDHIDDSMALSRLATLMARLSYELIEDVEHAIFPSIMGAVLDKIVRLDMFSEGLRICYDGCNGRRTNNADPGNGSKSLARLVRPILRYDPLLDRSNKRLQGLKLCCQCDKAYASINGQAITFFIGDDCRQLLKSLASLRRRNAQLRQMGSQRIVVLVRYRMMMV